MSLLLDAPQLAWQVKGDPVRLNQILTNLIGNAIKFTKEGSILTRFEIERNHGDYLSILFK